MHTWRQCRALSDPDRYQHAWLASCRDCGVAQVDRLPPMYILHACSTQRTSIAPLRSIMQACSDQQAASGSYHLAASIHVLSAQIALSQMFCSNHARLHQLLVSCMRRSSAAFSKQTSMTLINHHLRRDVRRVVALRLQQGLPLRLPERHQSNQSQTT